MRFRLEGGCGELGGAPGPGSVVRRGSAVHLVRELLERILRGEEGQEDEREPSAAKKVQELLRELLEGVR